MFLTLPDMLTASVHYILQVDMFHSVLHLLLQQVPPHQNGSAKSAKSQKNAEEQNTSSGEDTEDEEETMSEMFMNSDCKLLIEKMTMYMYQRWRLSCFELILLKLCILKHTFFF